MITDLDFGTSVTLCPTIREKDGLALSSRNSYLKVEERRWAPILYATLKEAAAAIATGEVSSPKDAERFMKARLRKGPGRLDYASVVDAESFGPPLAERPWLLALAYRMPSARLIDNVRVVPGARRTGSR
jgi:pantoate--beta-alanine ligase